jgi:hypothetical protein
MSNENENENYTVGLDDPESIIAMRRRHVEIALRMQKLACIGLAEWEAKLASGQKLDMSAADAKALLDVGMELERAAIDGKKPDDDAPIPWPKKPH